MCFDSSVVTGLCFGTGAAPSVLLKVAVLCVVATLLLLAAGGVCVHCCLLWNVLCLWRLQCAS